MSKEENNLDDSEFSFWRKFGFSVGNKKEIENSLPTKNRLSADANDETIAENSHLNKKISEGVSLSDSFVSANPELFNETNDEFFFPDIIANTGADENLETSLDTPMSLSFMEEHKDLLRSQSPNFSESVSVNSTDFVLKPGSVLYDYAIGERLGVGGMGEVYKAVDIRNKRDVAIKILKVKSHSAAERFRREYKFLSSVDHPNLIKAYDFREFQNELFLIMEFVEGKSLKQLISEHRFTFIDKIAIACQIAQGVQVLNLAGIIHRDIKPANIMVNENAGVVKILDLGLSKDTQNKDDMQLTQAKQILGTCFYMAPEQTEGTITTTTDIFALGTVLYQWFSESKESPFFASNQYRAFMRIMTHHPTKLQDLLPLDNRYRHILQRLSRLIEMAMQKDPGKRVANAGIMARELMQMHRTLSGSSPQKWQQTDISNDFHQILLNAAHIFRDKDVSLSGEEKDISKKKVPIATKTSPPKSSKVISSIPNMLGIEEPQKPKMYTSPRLARTTGALPRQNRTSGQLRRTQVELHRDDIHREREELENKRIHFLLMAIVGLIGMIVTFICYIIFVQSEI